MQVLGNQNHDASRQHNIYPPHAHQLGELPCHDGNLLGHGLWRSSGPVCHPDGFTAEHQATHQYTYSTVQPFSGATSGIEYDQATSFPTPSDEWPPDLTFDATCDKYRNYSTPPTAPLYLPTPQNTFAVSPETPRLNKEMERDNELSCRMSPTSPFEGPRSQKKRNRNRLAAAKCRKKAKRGVDDLQQRERDLLRENKMLNAEAGLLRDEVLRLKSEILRHSNCDNDYIHHYIQRAAKQVGAQSEDANYVIRNVPATI
ncbi:hypothetical protein F4859DRAFT_210903 [Xylaria cf. heliscus]|nr:hypothetical protein F4859DRAFT_210903 [Xylaria cf. heliscus]